MLNKVQGNCLNDSI